MAVYRQIHISFWQDPFVLDLTPEEKYFYLYLMTNSKTTQCGIYEITKKVMCFETGYNMDTIDKLLARFKDYKKIDHDTETNEIFLVNWIKHNPINNVNIEKCVTKELTKVKSSQLMRGYRGANEGLGSGSRTPTKKEEEEEEEQEEEKEETPYENIVALFHNTCPQFPKVIKLTKTRKVNIRARFKEHNSIHPFRIVFQKATDSEFLSGISGKWTGCNFDWLIKESNFLKVLEGNYDNKQAQSKELPIDRMLREEGVTWDG